MRLQLTKPLAVFDLETTGINIANDRIVEIAILKIMPDGSEDSILHRVNPMMPIPAKSSAIHGIFDNDVADKPTFSAIAKELANFIKDCDIAGYNSNKFDVPLIAEEFQRAGVQIDWTKKRFVDIQVLFHKKEPRTLSAAYKFYCDQELENAHSAMADTRATFEILKAQLERYPDLAANIQALSEFTAQNKNVDFAGRIVYDEKGVEVFNFGKHKGRSVEEIFRIEPSYYAWMMDGDFTLNTKQMITAIKLRGFGKK